MKYKYEEMFPNEFIQAVSDMPVFYLPTGLLEWHGDHMPLGVDSLKSYGLCCRIAEQVGGVVLPPNYIGRPGYSSYTGTLTYSEGLVNLMFYEMFYQLKKVGAKLIVLLTGHYGPLQVDCVKRVAECFSRENPEIAVIACAEYEGVTIDGETPEDHASKWETSIFWSMYPEMVKMENLSDVPLKQKVYLAPPNDYYKESEQWTWFNDVENASVELGDRTVDAIVEHLVNRISNVMATVKN